MVYLLFAFLTIHLVLLLILQAGLVRAFSSRKPGKADIKFLSVIVPYRNESARLEGLIRCLKAQEYEHFQVLLVNDHSSDGGESLVRNLVRADQRFILLESLGEGKKHALSTGVRAANGEVIVTTDADCTFGPGWLSRINERFASGNSHLVFGPVVIKGEDFFSRLQSIEFLSVIGVGIASFAWGKALYCNGANMAFRKDVFNDVDGYAGNLNIASGDDEFLLKKVAARFPGGIHYLDSTDAVVGTGSQQTIKSFLHQRIRWAGKSNAVSGSFSRVLAIGVFLVQIAALIATTALLIGSSSIVIDLLLCSKVIFEFVILFNLARHFGVSFRITDFLILQIIYPVYIIVVGIAANFSTFEWKGRTYSYRTTSH